MCSRRLHTSHVTGNCSWSGGFPQCALGGSKVDHIYYKGSCLRTLCATKAAQKGEKGRVGDMATKQDHQAHSDTEPVAVTQRPTGSPSASSFGAVCNVSGRLVLVDVTKGTLNFMRLECFWQMPKIEANLFVKYFELFEQHMAQEMFGHGRNTFQCSQI